MFLNLPGILISGKFHIALKTINEWDGWNHGK